MSAVRMGVSIREFARLDGCNDKRVRTAISAGHLKTFPDGSMDPELAGTGWRPRKSAADKARTVRTDDADDDELLDLDDEAVLKLLSSGGANLAVAERIKASAMALKHLVGARQLAGALVEIETAERVLFEIGRQARDAWMNFPARIGPLLAADLDVPVDKAVEALTGYVHQVLAELGEPEADFSS